jgi:hypothetical protein
MVIAVETSDQTELPQFETSQFHVGYEASNLQSIEEKTKKV